MAGILGKVTTAIPFNRVQDSYFHTTLPSVAVRAGKMADIPVITGKSSGKLIPPNCLVTTRTLFATIRKQFGRGN